jgi:hypothetical protein
MCDDVGMRNDVGRKVDYFDCSGQQILCREQFVRAYILFSAKVAYLYQSRAEISAVLSYFI